jgi:mycofactocin precursor peptide peptidase
VLVAPAVPFGSSGEHDGFAGTLSIGQAATELLVVELVRSAARSFGRTVLVCAHGGNAEPVTRAVDRLRGDGHRVLAHFPHWPTDSHAGHDETSLMLALAPERVRRALVAPGATASLPELWPRLRAEGVRAVSPTGVLGDPRRASAAAGRALLGGAARELRRLIEEWPAPS